MLNQEPYRSNQAGYIAYCVVMFFILATGFVGNILTILVLKEREHRRKLLTPLMMNLAVADLSFDHSIWIPLGRSLQYHRGERTE